MGRDSSIEWTNHTFNPWWGCAKVSPACNNCYAETWAKRVGLDLWGSTSPRRFFGDKHWREPLRWEREARRQATRKRVFCASMADVFEARADLDPARGRLWELIESTPSLDWLLLTKRPQNAAIMAPWGGRWPGNVWLGTTVESQEWTARIEPLLRVPARVHFLSCEPLLGPLDVRGWLGSTDGLVRWLIAGGESGPRARPLTAEWLRDLRDQCTDAGASFHFKQWGEWGPRAESASELVRLGKKAAGRHLDGRTWDEVPILASA